MTRTLDQIRREGLEALRRQLGRAGMIRFLQQFDSGHGDYCRERRQWVESQTMDQVLAEVRERQKRSRRPTKKK